MVICPCCSHPLLRHIRARQTYWFCRHCWDEIIDLRLMAAPRSSAAPTRQEGSA